MKKAKWYSEKDLRVLSLFSGCGGLDLGFEGGFDVLKHSLPADLKKDWHPALIRNRHFAILPLTRFKTVFANDINKQAQIIWTKYFSKKFGTNPACFSLESIVDLVKKHKRGHKNVFPKNIDVLTGGFPCQDFSTMGSKQRFDSAVNHNGKMKKSVKRENRGNLYKWMTDVIKIVMPNVFIAENVKGVFFYKEAFSTITKYFKTNLAKDYFLLEPRLLDFANYGVPQIRRRLLFVGIKKSALKKQRPFDFFPHETHLKKHVTTKQALAGLTEPEISRDLDQQEYSRSAYCPTYNRSTFETPMDGPSYTVVARGDPVFLRLRKELGGKNYKEGMKERRITVRETSRVQTFPDDFCFIKNGLKRSGAYYLLGNAVPPLMAWHVARHLESQWDRVFKKRKKHGA